MNDKYQEFIKYLFDRQESKGDWRFDFELVEPKLTGDEVVDFVKCMLENYERDLINYSDWQLGLGIEYIFNHFQSDFSYFLRDGPSSVEKRVEAIHALKVFFEKCLNVRCKEALGHLSEPGNRLNYLCYMFWDITPLTYCENIKETKEKNEIYFAVAEVMEFSLSLNNIACIESGLHGLKDLGLDYKEASHILKSFIKNNDKVDKRLIEYAKKIENLLDSVP